MTGASPASGLAPHSSLRDGDRVLLVRAIPPGSVRRERFAVGQLATVVECNAVYVELFFDGGGLVVIGAEAVSNYFDVVPAERAP